VRRHLRATPQALQIDVRRLIITSGGVAVSMLAISSFSSADLLLVKHFFSPSEAGLYSVVSLAGKILLFVVGFIPTLVLPKATARSAAGISPLPILVQAAVAIFAICGCGLLALWIAPGTIVQLMSGPAFASAAPLVFEYGLAMTILGATSAVVAYNVAVHRFAFVPWLLAVALAEIVAINMYHPALLAVVRELIAGNTIALVVAVASLREARPVLAVIPATDAA
jgi:O-antigen/teichoic acid export membrane protein